LVGVGEGLGEGDGVGVGVGVGVGDGVGVGVGVTVTVTTLDVTELDVASPGQFTLICQMPFTGDKSQVKKPLARV
jgi:hypothetical protein